MGSYAVMVARRYAPFWRPSPLAAASAQSGTVTITYTLHHIPRIASNQLAVWIEDAEGRFVRTLFATDFMARRRGFSVAPRSAPSG